MRSSLLVLAGIGLLLVACTEKHPSKAPIDGYGLRLELAREYLQATKRVDHIHAVYEDQLKLSMTFCRGKPCQSDLDKATANAALQVSDLYGSKVAQIYAQRLSAGQLRAAIRFANSPDGQAFTRASDSATEDLAQLGHSMMEDARQSISHQFCPSHREICVPPAAAPPRAPASVSRE